jgi:hypothetical protein
MLRILVWFTDLSVRRFASIFRDQQAKKSVLKVFEPGVGDTVILSLVLFGPENGSIISFVIL